MRKHVFMSAVAVFAVTLSVAAPDVAKCGILSDVAKKAAATEETTISDGDYFEDVLKEIAEKDMSAFQYLLPSSFDDQAKNIIIMRFDLQDAGLSDEQLQEIYDYLKNGYTEKETDDGKDVELPETLPVYSDHFSSEKTIGYPLFECVQEMCRSMDYVAQILNPEYSFNADTQTLDYVRVYLSCFADADKEELQSIIENNTDQILSALQYSFPNVQIDIVSVNWKIPVIDEESLYSASYWCECKDGIIERGDGTGELYQ